MITHHHRVLVENGITPQEWAVLSAASYLLPASPSQLVLQAQLGSEDEFSEFDMKLAGISCGRRGWIIQDDEGIALTDEGRRVREQIEQELTETVELL